MLLFFASTLFFTIRLALAEAQFRVHSMPDPEAVLHSSFWAGAANLARYGSSPNQLWAAVGLNPRLSSAWISLGLDAEANGNLTEAETDLLHAARVDHLYLPAWTLANFYFRLGDVANFWRWARRAAALTFDDYRPLLRLADALESSSRVVVARLAGGAPLLRAYLDLLIGLGRLDSAQEVAELLKARHDPADQPRLADFAERRRSSRLR
jgi:tetratricopeptide (TPR) repeat protein